MTIKYTCDNCGCLINDDNKVLIVESMAWSVPSYGSITMPPDTRQYCSPYCINAGLSNELVDILNDLEKEPT